MDKPQTLEDIIKGKLQDYEGESTHYKGLGIEPWNVVDTWPIEQQIGYHRGNLLKYTMRLGVKDAALKEAKKIRHYAEKLIEVLEKTDGTNP